MAQKITRAFVERQLENLNRLTGKPSQPYFKNEQGVIIPQAGCYHLDNAFGGYKLCQMSSIIGSTGTSDVGNMGYRSLAVVSNHIRMFSEGYMAAKEATLSA
jgi:hypothetical protein